MRRAYNEEEVIAAFYERTKAVLGRLAGYASRILFVVDRCTDDTMVVLRRIAAHDRDVRSSCCPRASATRCRCWPGSTTRVDADVIVMMDSDLQHPPELIPELLAALERGRDVVFTVRRESAEIGRALRGSLGNLFYRVAGVSVAASPCTEHRRLPADLRPRGAHVARGDPRAQRVPARPSSAGSASTRSPSSTARPSARPAAASTRCPA